MKHLFLASIGRNTLDKFVESLNGVPTDFKVAFIPTASTLHKNNWFVVEDRNKLIDLGFKVVDINLEHKTKKQLSQELRGFDIIFVAGGNTFYLLQEVRKSHFDEVLIPLIEKGVIYIGSSAGTLLVGPSIELAENIDNQLDAPELNSYEGLGLVDFAVLPHYNDSKFKQKIDQNILSKRPLYKTIKISDHQAVLVRGGKFKIISSN